MSDVKTPPAQAARTAPAPAETGPRERPAFCRMQQWLRLSQELAGRGGAKG